LHARRVEIARETRWRCLFSRGWTDGLPVVPPTEERVLRMLTGTTRSAQDMCSRAAGSRRDHVEKVAVNAVMAGCSRALAVVIAALEATCNDQFNIHGVLATTMPVGPVIVLQWSRPSCDRHEQRRETCSARATPANLTIGRAVQLVIRNFAAVDRARLIGRARQPANQLLLRRDEVGSPWTSLAASRGLPDVDCRHRLCAKARVVSSINRPAMRRSRQHLCRVPALGSPSEVVLGFDAIVVIGPEHARVFHEAGWDRDRLLSELHGRLQIPGAEIVRGAGGSPKGCPTTFRDLTLPKFRPTTARGPCRRRAACLGDHRWLGEW